MFGLFKKKSQDKAVEIPAQNYVAAPGSQIYYSPTLVDELKKDHWDLIDLYTEIKSAANLGDYKTVAAKLTEFRFALQGHLLTENVRFYVYISRVHGDDEMNSKLIHDFRREMDAIGKVAINFLEKYEKINQNKALVDTFLEDFAHIGVVLTERIKQEEKVLYPLYMPVY